jgi:Terpene cyclase DEP1
VTTQLLVYGVLGVLSTAAAFSWNRRLFTGHRSGPISALEGIYYFVAISSLVLGWYFNIRYTHQYGHQASYVNYIKLLFTNWAADSAAQDYTITNLVLMPLWTITEGRRRGLKIAWIFFIMSLFTSLAFSIAMFLAFMERQDRYVRAEKAESRTS